MARWRAGRGVPGTSPISGDTIPFFQIRDGMPGKGGLVLGRQSVHGGNVDEIVRPTYNQLDGKRMLLIDFVLSSDP